MSSAFETETEAGWASKAARTGPIVLTIATDLTARPARGRAPGRERKDWMGLVDQSNLRWELLANAASSVLSYHDDLISCLGPCFASGTVVLLEWTGSAPSSGGNSRVSSVGQ